MDAEVKTPEVVLKDGRKVTLRPSFIMSDVLNAKRMCGKDKDLFEYAIIAARIMIDGKRAHHDDVLALEFPEFESVVRLFPEVEDFMIAQGS
jgi:hypothetical protein